MKTSTKDEIEIEDLMTSLTSMILDMNYKEPSQSFIVTWLNKLRQYENLTPQNAHFPDSMKKAMLQNSL